MALPRLTVDFERSQLAEQRTAGVRSNDLGKGIAARVALAACLSREDRRSVDQQLAAIVAGLSTRQVELQARRLGYQLDPHSFLTGARKQRRIDTSRCDRRPPRRRWRSAS